MARLGQMARILLAAALVWLLSERPVSASEIGPPVQQENVSGPAKLTVTVGKSLIIDSPLNIQRVSVADGDLVEAVAVNPKEVLLNGKGPGETSLIVWQQNGNRLVYDLTVRMSPLKLEAVREQIAREFPDSDINVTFDNDTAFLRGAVKDVIAAERVVAIAATLGKTVNLLRVEVPPVETQILLKVRFADVDRTASSELGVDLASTALNQSTSITTGQFPGLAVNQTGMFSLSNALNIFLFRNDLNLGAAIQALETKGLLETLAEPNVLAINGQPASFLSGGEFPYPMVQGGGAIGTVTIAFREYGIRLNFLPVITPRGTIRLIRQQLPQHVHDLRLVVHDQDARLRERHHAVQGHVVLPHEAHELRHRYPPVLRSRYPVPVQLPGVEPLRHRPRRHLADPRHFPRRQHILRSCHLSLRTRPLQTTWRSAPAGS